MGIKSKLFKDFKGCTNGDCIIHDVNGMMTNGSCSCLHNLSRSQLHILKSRLQTLNNDNRLNDNFETALSALIEHHGADALTALAAVMRHHKLAIGVANSGRPKIYSDSFTFELCREIFTANDIKPEK